MIESAPRPMTVLLSQGGSDDLDPVMDIMAAAFDPRFGEGWTRSQCSGILPLSGVVLTIARDQSGLAQGFSLLRTVADEAELLLLAVAPKTQGRGVGGVLLRHFIDLGRRQGIQRLHLEVRDGNPAVEMYRAFGFSLEGKRPNYYCGDDGSRHDALTMARSL